MLAPLNDTNERHATGISSRIYSLVRSKRTTPLLATSVVDTVNDKKRKGDGLAGTDSCQLYYLFLYLIYYLQKFGTEQANPIADRWVVVFSTFGFGLH